MPRDGELTGRRRFRREEGSQINGNQATDVDWDGDLGEQVTKNLLLRFAFYSL